MITAAAAGSILNVAGIQVLLGGILLIMLLVCAIRFAMHALSGNFSGALGGVVIIMIVLFVWGLAHVNLDTVGGEIQRLIANI